ncbi:trans-aconitate 2-methyltransferase [Asticcacaulis sp. AC402]|uniref:class I SAM-dependent methyltransferase n=1 Tax=Asticcacaulis sp. AC402 TaxID=1282361 RepID=UPI00138AF71A|nr:class I SAM-dependent methyltransferase [Asticcacaulis sp. AC402]
MSSKEERIGQVPGTEAPGLTVPQHQRNAHTARGRNLAYMVQAGKRLGVESELRILSFGCSSGEECLDFADVFPRARIVGVDLNAKALQKAQALDHPRVHVMNSTEDNIAASGPYDIIFAMNVLCLHPLPPGTETLASAYPFALFESAIQLLDAQLKPGGVLGIYNSHYFLDDAEVFAHYAPIADDHLNNGWLPKYRPDGELATRIVFQFDGQLRSRDEWLALIATDYARRKDEAWHEWIDPDVYSGRFTDVTLWEKS